MWSESLFFIQEVEKATSESRTLLDANDEGKVQEAQTQTLISNVTEEIVSKLYKLRKALCKG